MEKQKLTNNFENFLIGRIIVMERKAKLDKSLLDTLFMLRYILENYRRLEKTKIDVTGWKGKSSLEIKKLKDKIIVTKYQRPDQDSKPRKVIFEYTKKEFKYLLTAIKLMNSKEFKSKELADKYFRALGKYYTSKDLPLFVKGKFNWDNLYNSRVEHNKFVIMLDVLRERELIEYKGGKIIVK
jgi:hypothetical protein